jgi:hypothetical protein
MAVAYITCEELSRDKEKRGSEPLRTCKPRPGPTIAIQYISLTPIVPIEIIASRVWTTYELTYLNSPAGPTGSVWQTKARQRNNFSVGTLATGEWN